MSAAVVMPPAGSACNDAGGWGDCGFNNLRDFRKQAPWPDTISCKLKNRRERIDALPLRTTSEWP